MLQTCERSLVSLTQLEKFRTAEGIKINHFAFDVIKDLPSQIEKFFELQSFYLDIA